MDRVTVKCICNIQTWESLKVYLKLLIKYEVPGNYISKVNHCGCFYRGRRRFRLGRRGAKGVGVSIVGGGGGWADRQRWGWHGKGVLISDTSSFV